METVCGKAASAHYADRRKGQPTFLNLGEPYPHEVFTVVIWGNDRSKFGAPERKYRDVRIGVTGKTSRAGCRNTDRPFITWSMRPSKFFNSSSADIVIALVLLSISNHQEPTS